MGTLKPIIPMLLIQSRTRPFLLASVLSLCLAGHVQAQSADWQSVVWREPQVRYLLADLTLGGNAALYRDYATREKDPDSREAIRLWEAGVRVVNTNEFERRWVTNKLAKNGRAMRVVFRGSNRTITGDEVLLTSDLGFYQGQMRGIILALTMGTPVTDFTNRLADPSIAEALRRWEAGARALNTNWFELKPARRGRGPMLVFRGSNGYVDGSLVRLNSDLPYPETNVRYFMADIALGGSIEFYRRIAEEAHEMGCLEAVRRTEEGYRITNLEQFERKKLDGKTLITRKGSNDRISGMDVKLSTD
jgi:hypothetical protein